MKASILPSQWNKFATGFFLILISAIQCYAQNKPYILMRPITWNADRERLSLEYLLKRHGISQDSARIDPRMIVVHYTEAMSVGATFKTFNPVYLPGRRDLQSASTLNVSAHYIVGRNGTIYQLLPENYFARHTIGLNYCAIGIENIGSSKHPLTQEQLKANVRLIKYLRSRYNIDYVIGHHEYQAFQGTLWWKELNPTYITEKRDPGDKFIHELRQRLNIPIKLDIKVLP